MFVNKPIKIAKDIEGVRRSAFWHLSRRDHSQSELLKKLQRKTDNNNWIDAVINECINFNYLNDQRFSESFIRSAQSKGHGKARIRQDLKLKGINERLMNNVFEENQFNYIEAAEQLLSNKFHEAIVTQLTKQKAIGFLQAKGHGFDTISAAIDEHNTKYPTPTFNNIEAATELLSKKFNIKISEQKQHSKALRFLVSNGYDYSKSNQAIKLFNQQFE